MTRPARWRCHTCGETFTAYAAAQRHADTTGHRRLDAILEPYVSVASVHDGLSTPAVDPDWWVLL